MCGIVGYIGFRNAKETLLAGLEKLEYRGYDSSGIGIMDHGQVHIYKAKGKLEELMNLLKNKAIKGHSGIGHTRWATHGQPNQINAHPHQSYAARFTLVHNGIIENYQELKETYLRQITCASETDSEIIVHLLNYFSDQGLTTEEALREVLQRIKGSYALCLMDTHDPHKLYAAKNKSPLLAGIGKRENMVASDASAMIQVTNQFIEINDQEYVVLAAQELEIKNFAGQVLQRESYSLDRDFHNVEMGSYAHFMLKEIEEQPVVIRQLINKYQDAKGNLFLKSMLKGLEIPKRVYIIACGTSYHAGLVGKQLIEKLTAIPTEVHIASEFLYADPLLEQNSLFVLISQSGETADSRGVLQTIKKQGFPTLTITNVRGSTLDREAEYTLLTHAGPEIAVASTKAYTAQIGVLALLSNYLAERQGKEESLDIFQELKKISTAMEVIIESKIQAQKIVADYLTSHDACFFIGRQLDYAVCLEGALKLKEISYIQAEGYAGGELKHGPLALIEKDTPVFVLATNGSIVKNIRSNAEEVKARGANICVISASGFDLDGDAWVLPKVHPLLAPLVSVIPLQLIAYYAALARGCDVDKPRNLAKSVTVE